MLLVLGFTWYTINTMSVLKDPFFERSRSIKEVAEYIGVTRVYVERQVLAGHLRARKFSTKLIRVLPEDLREWMDRAATIPVATTKEIEELQDA
jgi:excisionase family DNA binding protein